LIYRSYDLIKHTEDRMHQRWSNLDRGST